LVEENPHRRYLGRRSREKVGPAAPETLEKNNPIDLRATGRLNKLYIERLKDNPEWATEARGHDTARLICCFFDEDTDIFCAGRGLWRGMSR
jgi:hypothetical protein